MYNLVDHVNTADCVKLTDAYGLQILYQPASTPTVDIVALHGLGGGCYSTWTADNGYLWLRDFLKDDADTARIMSYGYDVGIWKKAPTATPFQFARNFLAALNDKRLRRNGGNRRPLILVAHSLGGIVAKEALIYAHDRQDNYGDLLRSIRHIIFFGTPHQGTDSFSLAGVLNKLGQMVTGANNNSILENLSQWSGPVLQTNQKFVNLADAISFTTYVEEEPLYSAIIVHEGSATLNKPRECVITIAANHKTMCKFGSKTEYQAVGDRVLKILDDMESREAEDAELAERLAQLPAIKLSEGLDQVSENIKTQTGKQEDRHLAEDRRACHQAFLTESVIYEDLKNNNPERFPGTCQWVLQHHQYISWLGSQKDDLLWISADPGCGKSVLSRSLIDNELRSRDHQSTTCYFFFKDNEQQDKLAIALSAILHQLFGEQPELLKHALPAYKKKGRNIRDDATELWRILIDAATDPDSHSVICILDALDECRMSDGSILLKNLSKFYEKSSYASRKCHLKFLVTSRPYHEIQEGFQERHLPAIHLSGATENDKIHKEIDLVIQGTVAELAKKNRLSTSKSKEIEQWLLGMGHRTYLWLYLAMDSIKDTFSSSARPEDESVESLQLPTSVDDAYEKILGKIKAQSKETTLKILHIIVGARRPLTTAEMAIALGLALRPTAVSLKESRIQEIRLQELLRRLCGLFVFINHSRIYLIHQTAKSFLIQTKVQVDTQLWQHCLKPEESELIMAAACVSYLSLKEMRWIYLRESKENELRWDKTFISEVRTHECDQDMSGADAFLKYSAEHWPSHVRSSPLIDESVLSKVYDLHQVESHVFRLWFPLFWHTTNRYDKQPDMNNIRLAAFNGHAIILSRMLKGEGVQLDAEDSEGRTACYWAAKFGHLDIIKLLLGRGVDVNAQNGKYGTALWAASAGRHEGVVKLLLDHGADVNAQDRYGGSALQVASGDGHDKVVKLLLDHGADVNAQDEEHRTALQEASAGGHEKVVKLLLSHQANVNAHGRRYSTALQEASSEGPEEVVKLLLDHWVDTYAQDEEYSIALQEASAGGYEGIVKLLLDHGADINAHSGRFGTVLQASSARGHEEVEKLLLGHRVDVNAQDGRYSTALQAAVAEGHEKVEKLLLGHRVDVNAQDGRYSTALQAAAAEGHEKVVKLLLSHGANVNAQGGEYGSALQAASARGHEGVVKLLLGHGADVNAQGGFYGTALQIASDGGYEEVVKLLLDHGADVNAQGGKYGTALQAAAANGHEKVEKLLLDHEADVNAQGGHYGTALQGASREGHDKVVKLLLNHGADINAHGGHYGTALQGALARGHEGVLKLLLDHGADVTAQGGQYGTALQGASARGHEGVVKLLLDHGADVNAQGGKYGTALQAASVGGHEEVVKLLLSHQADINAHGGHYGTTLQAASAGGHEEVIKLLLTHEANVNVQGGEYGTALQAASREGHDEVVKLLLDHGADVNAQGGRYGTALQGASARGHKKVVKLLRNHGAR